MYSTKNIENILLAELSRKQEKQLMQDVSRDAELSYKEIWQVRKKEVYQRIFGNKYRIWIPLDIEVDTVVKYNLDEYNKVFEKYNRDKLKLFNYISDIYNNFISIATDYGQIPFELADGGQLKEWLLYWIKGYIKINKNIIKIGTLIKKLQSIIKKDLEKAQYDDIKNRYYVKLQQLETALADFNKRDRDERLPKELYLAGRNVPDEEIYGSTIKKDKLWICISRHPADVGAMSTRQGWKSCQNLDKYRENTIEYDEYNWHVKYDVALGTCIAYLITESDIKRSKERQNVPTEYDRKFKGKNHIPKTSLFPLLFPTARVLIKPYFSKDKQVYLTIGNKPVVYGSNTHFDTFTNTINSYLEEKQSDISGTFTIPRELYNEGLGGNKNTIKVKNGKIIRTTGKNEMYTSEREVPRNSTTKLLDKLQDIASSMEKSEEGIETEYKMNDNEYQLIIANKDNFNNENIKNNIVTIINSNINNCDIESTSILSFGYALMSDVPLYKELESRIPNEEKRQLLKYQTNADVSKLINKDIYKILKIWANKESVFQNCVFRCDGKIIISNKQAFNNCIFDKATNGIDISLEDFSKIKNTTFNNSSRIDITGNTQVSSAEEITGNTYNNTQITIGIYSPNYSSLLYFVGDTFNNVSILFSNSKNTVYFVETTFNNISIDFNNVRNKVYFVDCTFNGKLLKGTYKVKFNDYYAEKQLKNITAKTIQENAS